MSSITATNRVADILRTLTAEEKSLLKTQLAFGTSTATTVKTRSDLTVNEDMFWSSMCDAMRSCRLTAPGPPMPVINSKGIGRERFGRCATGMYDYISHACAIPLSTTYRRALYVEAFRCHVKWLGQRYVNENGESWQSPVTPKTLLLRIGELPQAVNRCYPGYVEARLLHVVIPLAEVSAA